MPCACEQQCQAGCLASNRDKAQCSSVCVEVVLFFFFHHHRIQVCASECRAPHVASIAQPTAAPAIPTTINFRVPECLPICEQVICFLVDCKSMFQTCNSQCVERLPMEHCGNICHSQCSSACAQPTAVPVNVIPVQQAPPSVQMPAQCPVACQPACEPQCIQSQVRIDVRMIGGQQLIACRLL